MVQEANKYHIQEGSKPWYGGIHAHQKETLDGVKQITEGRKY